MNCVFCTDVAQSGEVVHESSHAWVVLHEDWAVRGHAMIVARRHVQNVTDLTEHEWEHFSGVWRRAERALLKATETERVVVLKLGIATPHLHVHLYPVMNDTKRDYVFGAFDARARYQYDAQLVAAIRNLLTPSSH